MGTSPHCVQLTSRRLLVPHGSTLYDVAHPVKNLMFIESGFVRIGAVDQAVYDYLGPGDVCGDRCLQAGLPPQFARAVTDVVITSIPRARATKVVCRDQELAARLVGSLVRRIARYEALLSDLAAESIVRRIAKLLLRFQSPSLRRGWLEIPSLTNPEIAATVGTTRWQVSRILNRFKRMGIIRRHPGLSVDLDALRTFLEAGQNAG